MERYRPFEADLRAGMPYHEALKKHINTTVYPWQYGDIGTPPHWVGKVVTIDEMFKTGGVCRHLAILSGMFLERALETGVPNESLGRIDKLFYAKGIGHGWLFVRHKAGGIYLIDPAQSRWEPLSWRKPTDWWNYPPDGQKPDNPQFYVHDEHGRQYYNDQLPLFEEQFPVAKNNPMQNSYFLPSPPADATLDWFMPRARVQQEHVLNKVTAVHRDDEWLVVRLEHDGALRSYSNAFRSPRSRLSTSDWDMVKAYAQFFPFYFVARADSQGIADGYAIVASQVKRHYPIGEFRDALNREIRPIPPRLLDILDQVAVQYEDPHLQQHIGHLRVETPEQREAWGRDSRGYVRSTSYQQIQQEYPYAPAVREERDLLRKEEEEASRLRQEEWDRQYAEQRRLDAETARRENEAIEAEFQAKEQERVRLAEQRRIEEEEYQRLAAERAAVAEAERREKQRKKFAGMTPSERSRAIRDEQMRQRIRRNPKDLFEWFEDWVLLINMKNKELKAFLDSPLGKQAGLSKQQAKDWNNIKSGRVSGRRILKMRAKLGLTGPKDYIKSGPRIIEDYYEKALDSWTGPSDDPLKGETDWDWCKRQVRFVKRTSAFPYNPNAEERKGPLVRKQKTQSKPSRRLLSLWVWGHDPWRWARKNGFERMSPCPDVPWVGMTEKRKYGKVEVKQNPPLMITAPDSGKWEKRYEQITSSPVAELGSSLMEELDARGLSLEFESTPINLGRVKERIKVNALSRLPKRLKNKLMRWFRTPLSTRKSGSCVVAQLSPLATTSSSKGNFLRTLWMASSDSNGIRERTQAPVQVKSISAG